MEKYICIHGHFYQPPRENPWLEDIELQDSAHPYHDWNQRVTAECYAPNASSRILNNKKNIKKIINNYAQISFNFGPTILDWMETKNPDTYQAIIEADKKSIKNFSGHGSALAQTYNHMIMPLANKQDKYTQIIWGIKDFEHRFKRKPEGMWLPETAVDLETLDIMAELGITFTILTPYQAKRFRKIDNQNWEKVESRGIDPSMPYKLNLPLSGRVINIFFYDGPISQGVAFEGLLNDGEKFANRLLSGFSKDRDWPQLVNISTDGETYGHHHHYGDMALAYALNYIRSNDLARITNYSEFLETYPPTHEVEIWENTSWSCAHGVKRWYYDCGCNSGMHSDWNQKWREPLRSALDSLRDTLIPLYEKKAQEFLKDPWSARNDYIYIILDRSPDNLKQFIKKHSTREFNNNEHITMLKLLEIQRHAMLMYTSCGWFFDDISGIETVQIIQYAGRAIQLAEELFQQNIEPSFIEALAKAKSNLPKHKDGAYIYNNYVKPAKVNLIKVGAHYALSSLFKPYEEKTQIYCYQIHRDDYHKIFKDDFRITMGRARISSVVTHESDTITFAAIKPDNYNLNAGVRIYKNEFEYQELLKKIKAAAENKNLSQINHILNTYFEGVSYSLKELFKDEQRKITNLMINSSLEEVEDELREIYHHYLPLIRFLNKLNIPQPRAIYLAAQFNINTDLVRALSESRIDFKHVNNLLTQANEWDIALDEKEVSYTLKETLERLAKRLKEGPTDLSLLKNIIETTELARSLSFNVNLWQIQNIYYQLLNSVYGDIQGKAENGNIDAGEWIKNFDTLGEKLNILKH
ncbi:MAG: DUF3536 domain-containing protein [Clostridiales bacterium]|nr:DUF3536 domain-containing protein [Clostridiales bacterium]MCF8021401.1 DUF3536 domain-containing protein [Clostridiales bacterium]